MSGPWADRWQVICARLVAAATSRGGTATRHGDDVLLLHAPRIGTCLRVWWIEPGKAQVDAESLRIAADWALSDDEPEDLEAIVAAIMDGRAEVEVTTRFHIPHSSGAAAGGMDARSWVMPGWRREE